MKRIMILPILFLLAALAARLTPAAALPLTQTAQDGQALFAQKCQACHTIGGGQLVGPDLQGVLQRRDVNWLRSFISGPDKMIAAGDPVVQQLLAENNNVPMPNLGLTDADVTALLAYLENPGAAGAAPAQPVALPVGDAVVGRRMFTGQQPLAYGGPACLSCHTVQAGLPADGGLAGGSLGPDLTHVMQRYGEAGLAANLNQITFPTMLGPFQGKPLTIKEQADLLAFFRQVDVVPAGKNAASTAAPLSTMLLFLGLAVGLALALFALMLVFRPRRPGLIPARSRRAGAARLTR